MITTNDRSNELDRSSSIPLYKQIEQLFIGEIRRGILKPLQLIPSIADLESMFKVSRNTAIKSINSLIEDGMVVPLHGKGNYIRNFDRKNTIGIILPLNSHYFIHLYSDVLAGVQHVAEKWGYVIDYLDSGHNPRLFAKALDQMMYTTAPDFLVLLPPKDMYGNVQHSCIRHLRKVEKMVKRIAIIDRWLPGGGVLQVHLDRVTGYRKIFNRAIKKGCKKILFLGKFQEEESIEELLYETPDIEGDFLAERTDQKHTEQIDAGGYDLVMCSNDHIARTLLNEYNNKPDFYIASFDATSMATKFHPTITSIDPHINKAGMIAAELLIHPSDVPKVTVNVKSTIISGETF